MRTTLATLQSLSLLISPATGQTRAINIGTLTYVGTGNLTESGGTVIKGVSTYQLALNTTGVTEAPITFANAILLVEGTCQGTLGAGFPASGSSLNCFSE